MVQVGVEVHPLPDSGWFSALVADDLSLARRFLDFYHFGVLSGPFLLAVRTAYIPEIDEILKEMLKVWEKYVSLQPVNFDGVV